MVCYQVVVNVQALIYMTDDTALTISWGILNDQCQKYLLGKRLPREGGGTYFEGPTVNKLPLVNAKGRAWIVVIIIVSR
jgi:hypothetical protein